MLRWELAEGWVWYGRLGGEMGGQWERGFVLTCVVSEGKSARWLAKLVVFCRQS